MKLEPVFVIALSFIAIIISHAALASPESNSDSSQCSSAVVKLVGKHFGAGHFSFPKGSDYASIESGALIVAGRCKRWPVDDSKTIGVFAYDAGVEDQKQFLLAVVDTRRNRVIASHKETIYEGAETIQRDSLMIDTARYDLAPGIRAFGIDASMVAGHNCGDGGGGAERTLYVQTEKSLRPVLRIPLMSSWYYIKGNNPGCGPEYDDQIIENTNLAIGLGTAETNGYRDLVVSAVSSRDDGKPTGKKKFSYTIRYDGQRYPTEKMQEALEKWNVWTREPQPIVPGDAAR